MNTKTGWKWVVEVEKGKSGFLTSFEMTVGGREMAVGREVAGGEERR
ncbi:MAG: hypothetical protein ACOX3G_09520 [Armatimonadota bacterium]|jgi:hypothetical protein